MAVNTNFYATLNELMSRAASGVVDEVVDYDSFCKAGKVLSNMSGSDLANEFLTPLMNKVQKTISERPSYIGSLVDMYKGTLDYGVLEIIMGTFYAMTQSCFDGDGTLVDGQTYTDQFTVSLPDVKALYYTTSSSFDRDLTIRDTDLKGAFTSPEKMDAFIAGIFTDIANSLEFAKEQGRLGAFDGVVADVYANGSSESADETAGVQVYNMLSIYNSKMGTSLTASDCMYSDSFIRFLVSSIRDIALLMEKPSSKFNLHGADATPYITFTPGSYRKLKISSLFEKAIRVSVIDAFNKEEALLTMDYETLPYWQNIDKRLSVTIPDTSDPDPDNWTETDSNPIVAVMYDDRLLGEMTQIEATESTRNAKRMYTNYHWHINKMYWKCMYANCCIFVLA